MSTVHSAITRLSLRDQVLAVLRDRLILGQMKPGEIYSAQAIAAELGVSGSPVREAMLELVSQGLMAPIRNRGFMVVEVTAKDRSDIYQMRSWLEVPAMGSLAQRRDLVAPLEEDFRQLAQQMVDAAKQGDMTAYLEADRAFHVGLVALLDNPRLTQAIGDLRDQTRLYGLERLKARGVLAESAAEHAPILDAVVAGDVERTQALLEDHMSHLVGKWAGTDE